MITWDKPPQSHDPGVFADVAIPVLGTGDIKK